MNIKEMVKNKKVYFVYYKESEMWYRTEDNFLFPVPIVDAGTAKFLAEDKAMTFMRYIRKHLSFIASAKAKQDETNENNS